MNLSTAFLDELVTDHTEAARGLMLLGVSYLMLTQIDGIGMALLIDRDLVPNDEPTTNSEEIH